MHTVLLSLAGLAGVVVQAQEDTYSPIAIESAECTQPSICIIATNTCDIPYGSCYNGCDTITVSIPPCQRTTSDCDCSVTSTTDVRTTQTGSSNSDLETPLPSVHALRAQVLPSVAVPGETGTAPDLPNTTNSTLLSRIATTLPDTIGTGVVIVTSMTTGVGLEPSSSMLELPSTGDSETPTSLSSDSDSLMTTSMAEEPSPFINVSRFCALVAVEGVDKCHHRYEYMSNPCATSFTSIVKPSCSLDATTSSM